jgi:hypothetical protein
MRAWLGQRLILQSQCPLHREAPPLCSRTPWVAAKGQFWAAKQAAHFSLVPGLTILSPDRQSCRCALVTHDGAPPSTAAQHSRTAQPHSTAAQHSRTAQPHSAWLGDYPLLRNKTVAISILVVSMLTVGLVWLLVVWFSRFGIDYGFRSKNRCEAHLTLRRSVRLAALNRIAT